MHNFSGLLDICQRAARAGAAELLSWRGRFSAREKSACDMVTDADLASQRAIQGVIRAAYPDHGFLGEESPDPGQLAQPYCWVVDPLDGTTNYVHGFPCFAVSIGLVAEGSLVAATILDPIADECYTATLGGGSFLNGQPIRVSEVRALNQALVAVSFPPCPQPDSPDVRAFLRVSPRCQAVRRTGSAALNLAYVACGRLDAHWAHQIHSWDSAAGSLLVSEAGGIVRSYAGTPFQVEQGDYCVVSSQELFDEIHPLLRESVRGKDQAPMSKDERSPND